MYISSIGDMLPPLGTSEGLFCQYLGKAYCPEHRLFLYCTRTNRKICASQQSFNSRGISPAFISFGVWCRTYVLCRIMHMDVPYRTYLTLGAFVWSVKKSPNITLVRPSPFTKTRVRWVQGPWDYWRNVICTTLLKLWQLLSGSNS